MIHSDSHLAQGNLALQAEVYTLSVAIPRPVEGLFTYELPPEWVPLIRIGGCIKVPFGKSVTHAFVVEAPRSSSELPVGLSRESLKKIMDIGDTDLFFPPDVLALCRWAHEYYSAPLGEVLNCAASSVFFAERKSKRPIKSKSISSPLLLDLTPEQNDAFQKLEEYKNKNNSGVALLKGVTGSGKTEVYIELARSTLAMGKSVLFLVPEIALTSQLHRRFEQRLGVQVALWHSAVSQGKRRQQSIELRNGTLRVVVGARSAVFAPIQNLGLTIIDEEHDPTYKQEDRVRYHARDLAIVRGKITQSFTVLGSATPCLETRERVREGRFFEAVLNHRIAPGGFPQIELVDLRVEDKVKKVQAPLAISTVRMIQEVLDAGEQVIVYLNRRGFAAFLLCKDCGEVKGCPHCSVSLTVHKRNGELRCHLCAHREGIPDYCTKCQGSNLYPMGAGTESLETDLTELLRGAKVLRLDRDQITSAGRLEKLLDEFRAKSANILLGTQMLVKGHDFPGVTLVVVVLADALFRWPDFRAPERAYQILRQVAGRSGRGDKSGRVLVQTYDTEHDVLKALDGRVSEESFLETERMLRQALNYPPFGRLARLRFESPFREDAIARATAVTNHISQSFGQNLAPNLALGNPQDFSSGMGFRPELELLGPSEAFLEKINKVFRWDLLIKAKNVGVLHKAVSLGRRYAASHRWSIVVDVDPQVN